MSDESLWIFGYGSLVWRPAFAHRSSRPASIHGYVRRFWQGSTDHRGLPERPGRVVTLQSQGHEDVVAEQDEGIPACWGTAYEIPLDDPDGVLAHLDHRERGGYERVEIEMLIHANEPHRVKGLVYIASPTNPNYLGPASITEIGRQVALATGSSGPNPEYVFELARSLRAMGAEDEHVFGVESQVTRRLARRSP